MNEAPTTDGSPPASRTRPAILPGVLVGAAIVALWVPLWWALSASWGGGSVYYEYGWVIPPAALYFAWLRIQDLAIGDRWQAGPRAPIPLILIGALLLAAVLVGLRALELVDATWRRVLVPHALLTAALTTGILRHYFGATAARYFIPVLIFALVAVPLPSTVEQRLVGTFTDLVVQFSAEILRWLGHATTVRGDLLVTVTGQVEVTAGCSGMRSFQSLVAAALFFGELFRLRLSRRIGLIVVGALVGMATNTARAIILALISFEHGQEAFHHWHDQVGFVAFVAAILILVAAARQMEPKAARRKPPKPEGATTTGWPQFHAPRLAVAVLLAAVGAELACHGWFAVRPDRATRSPYDLVSYHERLPQEMRSSLDFDQNPAAEFLNEDHAEWLRIGDPDDPAAPMLDVLWLRYEPGNPRIFLDVGSHSPENCMASRGHRVAVTHPHRQVESTVGALEFSSHQFSLPGLGRPLFVFKTRWIDGMGSFGEEFMSKTVRLRLDFALHGEKAPAAAVVLASVVGCESEDEAWNYFAQNVFEKHPRPAEGEGK